MMADISKLRVNGSRLWASLMEMAEIGGTEKGGSCRLALTDEDRVGRDLFVSWCREIGCSIDIDDMGNIFARRDGLQSSLPPIAMGSHLDTQPAGGKFDGVYGVLAGLEVLRTLHENNVETKVPLEVIVWTNEEGSRFAPAMMSSGVYAGLIEKEFAWSRKDVNGASLHGELERIGYLGPTACGEHKIGGLLEPHIEQGPILEDNGNTIGVVSGGQGQRWFDVVVSGQDSHAGSTPMPSRKDALVAAAAMVTGINRIALENAPFAVTTVGELLVKPNSRNTIPGEVAFSIDIRHPNDDVVTKIADEIRTLCETEAASNSVSVELDEIWIKPTIHFNEDYINAIRTSAQMLGYSHQDIVSGAGHDACQVCEVAPTGMIFVPCKGGLSHNEEESAEPEHLEAGCNVLMHAAIQLANN